MRELRLSLLFLNKDTIMSNFVSLMINLLNVQQPELYTTELARGTKPGKAARKAIPNCAPEVLEVFGSAKLAVTVDEINEAYSTPVKSCMQSKPVGNYFSSVGIAVIWTSNFRILVQLADMRPVARGYGFHGAKAEHILSKAGYQAISCYEACRKYPIAGPLMPFNPYLDWHGEYYNSSDYTLLSYDEDDNYYASYDTYENEAKPAGSYETLSAMSRSVIAEAQHKYAELLGTLQAGVCEGDAELEVFLLEQLEAAFQATQYRNRVIAHEEFRARVLELTEEQQQATAVRFDSMRSLLLANGLISNQEQTEVSPHYQNSDGSWEDLPF